MSSGGHQLRSLSGLSEISARRGSQNFSYLGNIFKPRGEWGLGSTCIWHGRWWICRRGISHHPLPSRSPAPANQSRNALMEEHESKQGRPGQLSLLLFYQRKWGGKYQENLFTSPYSLHLTLYTFIHYDFIFHLPATSWGIWILSPEVLYQLSAPHPAPRQACEGNPFWKVSADTSLLLSSEDKDTESRYCEYQSFTVLDLIGSKYYKTILH